MMVNIANIEWVHHMHTYARHAGISSFHLQNTIWRVDIINNPPSTKFSYYVTCPRSPGKETKELCVSEVHAINNNAVHPSRGK